jgi:cytochrome P450
MKGYGKRSRLIARTMLSLEKMEGQGFQLRDGHVGILLAEREDHSRYRRLLSHSFSDKEMEEQQLIITSDLDCLLMRWREESAVKTLLV